MAEKKQTLLREMVTSHFQPLLNRYAFKEASYEGDDLRYSNEVLILRSPTFFLRFTTDRGCLAIDTRPTTDTGWIDLAFFLEFLGHPLDFANKGAVFAEESSPSFARALAAHFETILDLLQPQKLDKTHIRFREFLNLRAARSSGARK